MHTSNLALVPDKEYDSLSAIPKAQHTIEPKEQMIVNLEVQNQDLLQVVDKTTDAYEKIIEEKDRTIATLSDLNDKLCIALTKANSDSNSLELIHEASLRGVQNKNNLLLQNLDNKIQNILSLCESVESFQKNIPLLLDLKWLQDSLVYEISNGYGDSHIAYQSPFSGVFHCGHHSSLITSLKQQLDDSHKQRTDELIDVLLKEAEIKTTLIKSKTQSIKDDLEKQI